MAGRILAILAPAVLSVLLSFGGNGVKDDDQTVGTGSNSRSERDEISLFYKWGLVNKKVGVASFSLDSLFYSSVPACCSQLTIRSNSAFDVFFKVREHFKGWFSRADFRPLECRRENGDGAFDHYIYDWDANAIHAKVCMDGKQTIEMDIPVHKNVYDLSTIVFYIRSLGDRTLKPGVSMPVSFVMDTTVYDIKLTYIGRQSLTAPDGTEISTKNYSCSVVDGALFKGDTPIRFWFTDDRRPVLAAVMLPLRVGAVWGWNAAFRN